MKTLNISQRVTLRELYLGYSFKFRDVTSKTISVPYFKKSEISNHKYKLTYKEWKNIIVCFFKYLSLYLLTGLEYKIPSRLGKLQLRKIRSKKVPDWNKTREVYGTTKGVTPIYHKNLHTNGFRPLIKWYRQGQNGKFKYKWYWRFNFTKKTWKSLSNNIFNKFSIMNNIQEV